MAARTALNTATAITSTSASFRKPSCGTRTSNQPTSHEPSKQIAASQGK